MSKFSEYLPRHHFLNGTILPRTKWRNLKLLGQNLN